MNNKLKDEYQNTIYWLANMYGAYGGSISPNDEEWEEFAAFLAIVDFRALRGCFKKPSFIQLTDLYTYSLFGILVKTFKLSKCLHSILGADINRNNIVGICNKLYDAESWMSGINADLSLYLNLKNNRLFPDDALHDWKNYNTHVDLQCFVNYITNEIDDKELYFMSIMVKSIVYDLMTRIYSIFVTSVLLIMSCSPFYNSSIKQISDDLFRYLHFVLKNGLLIGMLVNSSEPDKTKTIEDRNSNDDTTQLLLVHSFSNYDAYCLRLDLPHKGVDFIHFNNRSPGSGYDEVKSCLFNKGDYERILAQYAEYPFVKDFFIEYEEIAALKERNNCTLRTADEQRIYDDIETNQAHISFSSIEYPESSIKDFIKLFSFSFYYATAKIDSTYAYAKKCFNCSKLIQYIRALEFSKIHNDVYGIDYGVNRIIKKIVDTGIKYRIIEKPSDGFYNMEGVESIVHECMRLINPVW